MGEVEEERRLAEDHQSCRRDPPHLQQPVRESHQGEDHAQQPGERGAARRPRKCSEPIHFDAVSIEERRAKLEAEGLAPWRVELLLGLDEINRSDLYATPTDTVRQLTGRPPREVEEYLERNRAVFST